MDFDNFLRIGQIRSKMNQYREKKERALELCQHALSESEAPYLALSGGKDSVAMAFITAEAARSMGRTFRLWTHLSDASFPGTEETCARVSEMTGMPLDLYQSEGSAFDALAQPERRAFGKSGAFFNSVRAYAADKDLCFVGVRARESKRRRQAAKVHGAYFRSKSMGDVMVCHPLLWFQLEDVAAALWEYEAPIHPIYRKTPIDSGVNSQGEENFIRLAYITSRDLLNKGTAVFLKVNYPAQYARLAEAWPEIRRFV